MSANRVAVVGKLGFAALGLALASSAFATPPSNGVEGGAAKADVKPAPAAAKDAAGNLQKGRELFADWSCGSCHALRDAGGTGHVGPSFDGNTGLTKAFIISRVTDGQGAMPAFGGQLTDEEIAELASYIVKASAK